MEREVGQGYLANVIDTRLLHEQIFIFKCIGRQHKLPLTPAPKDLVPSINARSDIYSCTYTFKNKKVRRDKNL